MILSEWARRMIRVVCSSKGVPQLAFRVKRRILGWATITLTPPGEKSMMVLGVAGAYCDLAPIFACGYYEPLLRYTNDAFA